MTALNPISAAPAPTMLRVAPALSTGATLFLSALLLFGYLAHIEDGGVITLHPSNKYMELASVVASLAAAEGLVASFKEGG